MLLGHSFLSFTLKMDAVFSSETSVNFYHVPGGNTLQVKQKIRELITIKIKYKYMDCMKNSTPINIQGIFPVTIH
jgi:hypothetical protein